MRIDDNNYLVIFDNRTPVSITSTHGHALHLLEKLLSPRHDMTYSEYLGLMKSIDEITQDIAA